MAKVSADMCRVCLKARNKSSRFIKILDQHKGDQRPILEHLKDLSPKLTITIDKHLPTLLCKKCLETLLTCSRFRRLAEKTDHYLNTFRLKPDDDVMNQEQIVFAESVKTETTDDFGKAPETPPPTEDIKEESYDTEDEQPLLAQLPRESEPIQSAIPSSPKRRRKKVKTPKYVDEDDGRLFYCCSCPKFFDKEQDTLDHYVDTHGREQANVLKPNVKTTRRFKFECKMCSISCKTPEKLRLHQKQYQTTKQCTECGVFVPGQKLDLHLRRHRPESERRKLVVECHICQRQLYSKKGMHRHLQTHNTELKYKCGECGKQLKTESAYYGHIYYHELRRKGKTVPCPACPATFHRATALEIHLRTHSGEKPFHCTYCDMKYADRSDLRRHMWQHTGESPYKCKRCAKMFTRKDYLRKHETGCNVWPTNVQMQQLCE